MSFKYYKEDRSEIDIFRDKYDFLSNFFPACLTYRGLSFYNSEAAYQAEKCLNPKDRIQFVNLYANEAKKLGNIISVRKDWEEVKINAMKEILYAKFTQNPSLGKYLTDTGNKPLLEGNTHNDTFWGIDHKTGKGDNHLGKLLMELRAEFIKNGIPDNSSERPVKSLVFANNITLTDEDITQIDAECIINEANTDGGLKRAIHRAAGLDFFQEYENLKSIKIGEAEILKGHKLRAKYIIHTTVPIYGRDDSSLLDRCYTNVLNLAENNNIHTIVFPALSTGKSCFPKKAAAEIAYSSVNNWIAEHADYNIKIIFSYPDQKNYFYMPQVLNRIHIIVNLMLTLAV